MVDIDASKINFLKADMPERNYNAFMANANWKSMQLRDSIKFFRSTNENRANVDLNAEYDVQSNYPDVPFRDESKGDFESTVASSGCALLVAKFIGQFFDCTNSLTIQEMAEYAVELGYRGYKQEKDGSWTKTGMKHVFFDRFVPRFYEILSTRIRDIFEVTEAVCTNKLPVLLVKDSGYNDRPKSKESRFIAIVGFDDDKYSYLVYDPGCSHIRTVPYGKVNKAIRLGWVFSD